MSMNETFGGLFAKELGKRDNPSDLKSGIIGKVVKVEPIIVSIDNGKILLTENEELEISEWFRFRCDIDKTEVLSKDVPDNTDSAESISETHSYTGSPCNMPSAISDLASAILGVRDELLKLKCELKKNDFVAVASLEESGKYILLDKVL